MNYSSDNFHKNSKKNALNLFRNITLRNQNTRNEVYIHLRMIDYQFETSDKIFVSVGVTSVSVCLSDQQNSMKLKQNCNLQIGTPEEENEEERFQNSTKYFICKSVLHTQTEFHSHICLF